MAEGERREGESAAVGEGKTMQRGLSNLNLLSVKPQIALWRGSLGAAFALSTCAEETERERRGSSVAVHYVYKIDALFCVTLTGFNWFSWESNKCMPYAEPSTGKPFLPSLFLLYQAISSALCLK